MIAWLALPLEVLPGWPVPEPASTLHILTLTVLGPLAVLAVLAVIGWTPRLMRKARAGAAADGVALTDGHAQDAAALAPGESPARRAAIDN
ncbi:hypothetical protein IPV09_03130 [Tessaracoccus sp. SD287]|uniref:hypothetical protein n=1 Tax=Tessaracoccus sp. SD287 TaxID=2782008 RepID=UPI001A9595D6|nr:hypothetical protein [Tessaracoccus sp. SD287]MBO1030328.1 hypothetical protein [Tessaracoccus sp. SD287]